MPSAAARRADAGRRGGGAGVFRQAPATVKAGDQVNDDEMILDIGPETARRYAELIAKAGTVVWNGPVGVFEFDAFGNGTETLARAIAASPAFSIAGGGDTLAAVDKYGIADDVSYISTGGGAFLEFLEGKELPAVTALKARAASNALPVRPRRHPDRFRARHHRLREARAGENSTCRRHRKRNCAVDRSAAAAQLRAAAGSRSAAHRGGGAALPRALPHRRLA
jgi:hypothetical protein